MGISLDVIRPADSLAARRLLIAPLARLMSDAYLEALSGWVQAGGVLVTVAHTALQDEWATYRSPMGGALAKVIGVRVARPLDWREPHGPGVQMNGSDEVLPSLPAVQPIQIACDDLEVIARFAPDTPYAGQPAAVRRRFGRGTALHAAVLSVPLLRHLLTDAAALAGVALAQTPMVTTTFVVNSIDLRAIA